MRMAQARIALLATLDTKLEEARFVAECIREHGAEPIVVNIGRSDVDDPLVDVTQVEVRSRSGLEPIETDKVSLMESAGSGARQFLSEKIANGDIDAAIAIGGGQGSWMASTALRDLPLGFPRLLVSTAGRDVGQFTLFSDLTNVFSITDIAGLNPLLRRVLATAAAGICGMARNQTWRDPLPRGLTAITMYGITTVGARMVMTDLSRAGIEAVAFHANGVGGQTMEGQIAAGAFEAVLDWSITELADEVVGGICAAGPDRLTNAARMRLPQVIVPGGVDVVNFAGIDTLPERLKGRQVHSHTPQATLLRTNVAENIAIAELVAKRLRETVVAIHIIVPLGGFSALSEKGGPLYDPEADRAFLDTLTAVLSDSDLITVLSHPGAINSREFADFVARDFAELVRAPGSGTAGSVKTTQQADSA